MIAVVVPWCDPAQRDAFLREWGINEPPDWLVLQQDALREGCAATKNRGVENAVDRGAEIVVVLDDDCYPPSTTCGATSLNELAHFHAKALEPQEVEMFEVVTDPPSRGTPYLSRSLRMPVAASVGFWSEVGDYCAPRQLAHAGAPMAFLSTTIYGRYFALSGMNVAFRPRDWQPWCRFIDVPRFDDIWMGWLWQREAYRRGCCFNLCGPLVRHARQSNVWRNLRVEAVHLEASETLWQQIATHPSGEYEDLVALLPPDAGGSDR